MRKPVPRVLYVGYTTGTYNHGDEELIVLIKDLLTPQLDVVCRSQCYDVALLGGGTLINQSPWLIDHFAACLAQAGHGVVFGSGVGNPAFWGNHFPRWKPLLERCPLVGVRGPDSLELLQRHGITHAEEIGDPYLLKQIQPGVGIAPRRLGVNLGSTHDSLWGTDDADLLAYVTAVLKRLAQEGWEFVFVSVWEKDVLLVQQVRDAIAPTAPFYDARSQTDSALQAIAGCEVFVGEKLHANAMAAVAGTPFVALEYQPKVRDFARSLGLEALVLSTAERRENVLYHRILQAREDRQALVDTMGERRAVLCERLRDFTARVKQTFGALRPRRQESAR